MIHVPALPDPTREQVVLVNVTREAIGAVAHYGSVPARRKDDLHAAYVDACIAAGVHTPPDWRTWPAPPPMATPKTPGDQRRATDRSMTR